jgi:hypothetical protein
MLRVRAIQQALQKLLGGMESLDIAGVSRDVWRVTCDV